MQTRGEVYAIPNSKSNLLRESVVSLTYFQLCVVCTSWYWYNTWMTKTDALWVYPTCSYRTETNGLMSVLDYLRLVSSTGLIASAPPLVLYIYSYYIHPLPPSLLLLD